MRETLARALFARRALSVLALQANDNQTAVIPCVLSVYALAENR